MITSRRKRKLKKHPNAAKQHNYISLDTLVTVIFATLLLIAIIQTDDSSLQQENDKGHSTGKPRTLQNDILETCNDTCSNLLFASDDAFSESPLSSLGAVNNLLRLRENAFDASDSKNGAYDMVKEYNAKYYPRPPRLPPLIEKLVGNIDMNSRGYHTGNKKKKTKAMINTDEKKDTNNIISQKVAEKDKITAAMAAAAVASVQAGKKGIFRMKNLNNEWDRALQWIAGWDLLRDDSDLLSSHQKGISRGKNIKGFLSSKNKDVFLLKTCMEECIENTPKNKTSRRKDQSKNSTRRKKRASSRVTDKKLRTGLFSKILRFARSNNMLVTAFCALILSALKYCTRFITNRSLSHRSDKVYEWLSSMEKDEYDKWSNNFTKQHGSKSMGKRGKIKKKAKKQECAREENGVKNNDTKGNNDTSHSDSETETDDETEDYIGTHIEFHQTAIRQHSENNYEKGTLKSNDEQIASDDDSTEGTVASTKWTVISRDPSSSSNASCTFNLDDSDCLAKNYAPHHHGQKIAQMKFSQVQNQKTKKTKVKYTKGSSSDSQHSKTLFMNYNLTTSNNSEHIHSAAQKSPIQTITSDKQQVLSPMIDPVVHRVPTDEERQEAFNRLREFQMTQIEKVMRNKATTSDSVDDSNNILVIETKQITKTNSPTSWSPFRSTDIISLNNPCLYSNTSDDLQNDPILYSDDCLTKTDLLLSKLLDEDEDEIINEKSSQNIDNSVAVGESWDVHQNTSRIPSSLSGPLEPGETDVWGSSQVIGSDMFPGSWKNSM